MPPRSVGRRLFIWAVGAGSVTGSLVLVACLYHPPVEVVEPGRTSDIGRDFVITGVPTTRLHGRYLSVSVYVSEEPRAIELIPALLRGASVGWLEGGGSSAASDVTGHADFERSRQLAAVAAAKAAGMPASVRGTGAIVTYVWDPSPANGVLRIGDVVIAVDGRPVRVGEELRDMLADRPAGSSFTLTVDRDGTAIERHMRTRIFPDDPEHRPTIGAEVKTRDFGVELPFQIKYAHHHDDFGPSAGLLYALAITDVLQQSDLANGRSIAATGEMDALSKVGDIGGLAQKTIAARQASADLFLVPSDQLREARGKGVRVRGATNLFDALVWLT